MSRPRLRADLTPLQASRDFRLLYASRTVIALGTQATEVALPVQARQLTVTSLLPSASGPLHGDPGDPRPGGGVDPVGSGVDPVDGGADRVGGGVDSVGSAVYSIGNDVGLIGNGVGFAGGHVGSIGSVVGLTRSNVDLTRSGAGLIRGSAEPLPGGIGPLRGSINLTVPLATWLGGSGEPGHAAGYGPLDAADSRDLADAIAAGPGGRWCLTFTAADGRPVAHGCARTGPPVSLGRTQPEPRAGPEAQSTQPEARPRGGPEAQTRGGSKARARGGLGTRPRDGTWTFTVTPLGSTACDHASETPGYRPSAALRHLVETRQPTCGHPGCRRPAVRCDVDHTMAYHLGGRTCLCNLAPLCRRHHRVKQARGWALEQVSPGVLTWSTPAGRRYTVSPI